MARPRAGDAVAIERRRLALEKVRIVEREKTRRLAIAGFYGTVAPGIGAWAAVRMTDKPPWLAFALAILGAVGAPGLLILRVERRLGRQIEAGRPILGGGARGSAPDVPGSTGNPR
jgi:hypothetical protein